ncbi:MAG: hypothetical protein AAGA32_09990 [Pseudomonadota bacterium]
MSRAALGFGAALAALVGLAALVEHAAAQRTDEVVSQGARQAHPLDRLITAFDVDGDGALTQAEINATRADTLATFDSDADGALSPVEFEALWLERLRPRLRNRFHALDTNGDGGVSRAEFETRTVHLIAHLDRSGDGLFSRQDIGRRLRIE